MDFIEQTIRDPERAYKVRARVFGLALEPHENVECAKKAEEIADYLTAAVHWRAAAAQFRPSQVSRMEPYLNNAERCENLYVIFYKICKSSIPAIGFGKRVAYYNYVHYLYKSVVPSSTLLPALQATEARFPGFIYNIVKWNRINNGVSLIWSPDFLTADEPYVRDSYTYSPHNGAVKHVDFSVGDNPPVYHHKWLFVRNDFELFDMAAAIKRSIAWKMLNLEPDIIRRIGKKQYWEENIVPRIVKLP